MATYFDGTGDRISLSPQARSNAVGQTLAAIVYREVDSGGYETIYFGGATGSGNPAIYLEPGGLLAVEWNGGTGQVSAIEIVEGNWWFISVTKATGASVTEFRAYNYTTDTWSTETSAGTETNPSDTARTNEFIGAHGAGGDEWQGEILALGYFSGQVATLEQVQGLVYGGLRRWYTFAPNCNFLHVLDQGDVANDTRDLAGRGYHESSRIGTSVSTRPDPPFWSRGGLPIYVHIPTTGGGSTPVEGDDTGTGTEGTGAVSASISGTDSGSGADTATLAASQTVSDSGSGDDSALPTIAQSVPETGSGTEGAPTIGATLARTDTGAGTEAGTIFVQLTVTDSGTGTDEDAVLDEGTTEVAGDDSGSGTEGTGAVTATLARTDSATATESATVTVTLSVTDTGTGTDEDAVLDDGSSEEIQGTDSFTATESATIFVTVTGTDTGSSTSQLAKGPRGRRGLSHLQLVIGRG